MVSVARDPVTAYVAVGANLGDALRSVRQSFSDLNDLPDIRVTSVSRVYRTAPHEAQGPDFINAVVQIDTRLTAPQLLLALQSLEAQAGRERPYIHAPRTLDLDLILYGDARISTPSLTVPHPRWRERAFVLYPLSDLRPDKVSPDDLARVEGQGIDVLPESAP